MDSFALWSRGDFIALLGLLLALAAFILPELRKYRKLGRRSGSPLRNRRILLFSIFLLVWLLGGVAFWRFIAEPKLVKWNVIAAMEEAEQPNAAPPRTDSETKRVPPKPLPQPVREVIEGSRLPENVGGGTAVVDMWGEKDPKSVPDAKITCVFEPVTDLDALSSLAVRKLIRIHDVRLRTIAKQQFAVSLRLENLTQAAIIAQIPKGQIFENKRRGAKVQNLASARTMEGIELPPGRVIEIQVAALCINRRWNPPNGGEGNITILKIRDNFSGQADLWSRIEAAMNSYDRSSG